MAEVPENAKYLLFGYGPRLHALMAFVANLLGIVALVLGIVSSAAKIPIGLDGTTWFLLPIILFIWGLSFWFSAYFGAKEGYTKQKQQPFIASREGVTAGAALRRTGRTALADGRGRFALDVSSCL
jgi:hypothetical protein